MGSPTTVGAARPRSRLFFPVAAILIVVLTALGFGAFYTHGKAYPNRPLAPPIRGLLIAHGISMSLWVVLLVVQTSLIALNRRKVHMALGKFGAVLAAAIVVLGLWVALRAAAIMPPEARIWGVDGKTFLAVPIVSMLTFAGLVAAGIASRRKPAIHRTLMVLATLAALPAAVSRIDPLSALYVGTAWEGWFGPYLMTLVFAALLVAARSVTVRSLDRFFALGVAALTVLSFATWQFATTAAWGRIATWLVG